MGRAERRRAQKSEVKAKTATYNLTRAQLDALVRERIDYELKKAREDAIADATILMLLDKVLLQTNSRIHRTCSRIF